MLSRSAFEMILCDFRAQRAANGVAAQRQHQAGGLAPPDAQIDNLVEPAAAVGELSLVNDQSGVVLSRQNLGNDLVERHDLGFDVRIEDLERQVSRGQGARNGDLDPAQIVGDIGLRLETTIGP